MNDPLTGSVGAAKPRLLGKPDALIKKVSVIVAAFPCATMLKDKISAVTTAKSGARDKYPRDMEKPKQEGD